MAVPYRKWLELTYKCVGLDPYQTLYGAKQTQRQHENWECSSPFKVRSFERDLTDVSIILHHKICEKRDVLIDRTVFMTNWKGSIWQVVSTVVSHTRCILQMWMYIVIKIHCPMYQEGLQQMIPHWIYYKMLLVVMESVTSFTSWWKLLPQKLAVSSLQKWHCICNQDCQQWLNHFRLLKCILNVIFHVMMYQDL